MSDHLLHIKEIEDGQTYYHLSCAHSDADHTWHLYRGDELALPEFHEVCWLQTWWGELGDELVRIKFDDPPTFPVAVKPSDTWDADGGTIVLEDHDCPPGRCCRTCQRHVTPHKGCVLR